MTDTAKGTSHHQENLEKLITQIIEYKNNSHTPTSTKSTRECYQNRFIAQKNAIETLNMRLEEKDKIIAELQTGIIKKDILKSLNETKYEIKEIFNGCSMKIKCKMRPPIDYSERFMVSTQKVPQMAHKMEERAVARAQYRQIIAERKRIIEAERKRTIEEAIENKRIQDEEDKKKNLELIRERRRQEMENEKFKQYKKRIFLEKWQKAVDFSNRKLCKFYFKKLQDNMLENQLKWHQSKLHYDRKLFRMTMEKWNKYIENKYYFKNQMADVVYHTNIIRKYFCEWQQYYLENIRQYQVAEDFYDFRLTSNTFIHWHRLTCIEIVRTDKKMKMAKKHYDNTILFRHFYLWRSLPAVVRLEKTKEEQKRKWREKVKQIIPDYKSPFEL